MVTNNTTLIGIAGVHYIVSKLSMRGIIALPTVRNTAGVDIFVSNKDGSKTALLQVKTSGKKSKFWPTQTEDKLLTGRNCYHVFLRYIKDKDDFEVFLVEGSEVKKQVAKNNEIKRKKGSKDFSNFMVYKEYEDVYKQNWEDFII